MILYHTAVFSQYRGIECITNTHSVHRTDKSGENLLEGKMINEYIERLVKYATDKELIKKEDETWAINSLLSVLGIDEYEPTGKEYGEIDIESTFGIILDYVASKGIIDGDSIVERDLFDTKLIGVLTPRPSEVISKFFEHYKNSPKEATDYFYAFSCNTDYIRTYRVKKDMRWVSATKYGDMDITINLSKPEKDPKAIAAARSMSALAYPKCAICRENEGYAGRINAAARQNHRIIPLTLDGEQWFMQYSPYVYYNEHCIILNAEHTPMKINRSTFKKLLEFVTLFPHYFIGSNADLPIVGGSILTHDHFQGGCYTFPMEKAPIEKEVRFGGYSNVSAGIVNWPLSAIRLRSSDKEALVELADKILLRWRTYTDKNAYIFAQTEDERHNTITPIARRRGDDYELDLVLRNNITTEEHPLGLYHPHEELHHIKKENIGLIEVMGLAVLPSRLKDEIAKLGALMASGGDYRNDPVCEKHADFADDVLARHPELNAENVDAILKDEIGIVFSKVLECAGVYKCTDEGRRAFMRFIDSVNA